MVFIIFVDGFRAGTDMPGWGGHGVILKRSKNIYTTLVNAAIF